MSSVTQLVTDRDRIEPGLSAPETCFPSCVMYCAVFPLSTESRDLESLKSPTNEYIKCRDDSLQVQQNSGQSANADPQEKENMHRILEMG